MAFSSGLEVSVEVRLAFGFRPGLPVPRPVSTGDDIEIPCIRSCLETLVGCSASESGNDAHLHLVEENLPDSNLASNYVNGFSAVGVWPTALTGDTQALVYKKSAPHHQCFEIDPTWKSDR